MGKGQGMSKAGRLGVRLAILAAFAAAAAVAIRAGWIEPYLLARWSGCPVPGPGAPTTYFERGRELKERGWIEAARVCMEKAIAADGSGETARRARRFATTRLPRQEVSLWAEWRNIRAVNAWHSGELAEAIGEFRALIDDHPQFEWPYSNLAALYLDRGEAEAAAALLERALELNPAYLSALVNMGRAQVLLGQANTAKIYALRALDADPQDAAARQLARSLLPGPDAKSAR